MQSESPELDIGRVMREGLEHHQSGRLPEAESHYQRVLQVDPNNPDALHLLGVIAHQVGKNEIAVELFGRALMHKPDYPEALSNCGNALQALDRYEEALVAYSRALSINPDYAEAHYNCGNALVSLKHYEAALKSYGRAIAVKPDYAEAFSNRGLVLNEFKRYAEALSDYDSALMLRPNYAEALSNRGDVLQALNRHGDALPSYDSALAIKPNFVGALSNRGNALHELKRYEDALMSYDRALVIKPDNVEVLANRGKVLQALKRYTQALESYDRALALKPDHVAAFCGRALSLLGLKRYKEALLSYDRALEINPGYSEALINRGNALQALQLYAEALASYDRALETNSDLVVALCNRGQALEALKRHGKALANYEQALAIRPDFAEAHWNESLCLLKTGNFERGWKEYEWRWKWDDFPSRKHNFRKPIWLGSESIADKTILLHAEQGLGDTLQFVRYVPMVAAICANVVLQVQPTLVSLLSGIVGASQITSDEESLPRFDFHCPLLSLPLAFSTRLETVPASVPYLFADNELIKNWDSRLGRGSAMKVGIVWSGRAQHKNDHNRSMSASKLAELQEVGVTLVSLQNDVREEDKSILAANRDIIHFGSELRDFSDAAALVSLMDLVISVDTSVAHLAGAMGKPVWILLPYASDWRWLIDREDSPWYPTARLFRQPAIGDWDSVMYKVGSELREISCNRKPQ